MKKITPPTPSYIKRGEENENANSSSDFLLVLEKRMEENRELMKGGVPKWLVPAAWVIGNYSWQIIVGVGFLVSLLLFVLVKTQTLSLVKIILLME